MLFCKEIIFQKIKHLLEQKSLINTYYVLTATFIKKPVSHLLALTSDMGSAQKFEF